MVKGRGAWCSGRNRTCFFGSSFAAAAIEAEGTNRLLYMYSRNVGLRPTVWQVERREVPHSGNCQSMISIFQSSEPQGNFEIIIWKLGTLYIVLLSFRDTTTYRGGDDAELAVMKFSVTSKSNPNIYVWSRSQVQKESLLHCCNHWEKNDLLTASILSFYLLPFPLISATAVLEGPR